MRLPSFKTLWLSIKHVAVRFPLQTIIAVLATVVWCYVVHPEVATRTQQSIKLLVVCNFAFTLLLAFDTYAESNLRHTRIKWLMRLLAVLFAAALYVWLNPYYYTNDIFRIALLAFAFHLLVAFAPFMGRGNLNSFWQYNKALFLRFLTATFYAAVLFAGLAVALMAVDGLFNVNISFYHYLRLLALVSAGFTTLFFLAGVPSNFLQLEEEQNYPKALKVFTQYVLIPLLTIYLAILLVYEIKIIINWELPKGLVSTLILGYAVFGMLSLLLVYPIREKEGNSWVKLFSKLFYIMMIPLLGLLILAIAKRLGNYGITESRYILIVLAAWLTGITIYFLFSKKQNIKIIPISLFILTTFAVYGPQSAFSVAKASQTARLQRLLDQKNEQQKNEIPGVVTYLVERHGMTAVQDFTKVNLAAVEERIYARGKKENANDYEIRRQQVDTTFALLKISRSSYESSPLQVGFDHEDGNLITVKGYDVALSVEGYFSSAVINFDGVKMELVNGKIESGSGLSKNLTVKFKGQAIAFDVSKLMQALIEAKDSAKFSRNRTNNFVAPAPLMQFSQQMAGYTFTFVVTDIHGYYKKNSQRNFEDIAYNGYLLIKKN